MSVFRAQSFISKLNWAYRASRSLIKCTVGRCWIWLEPHKPHLRHLLSSTFLCSHLIATWPSSLDTKAGYFIARVFWLLISYATTQPNRPTKPPGQSLTWIIRSKPNAAAAALTRGVMRRAGAVYPSGQHVKVCGRKGDTCPCCQSPQLLITGPNRAWRIAGSKRATGKQDREGLWHVTWFMILWGKRVDTRRTCHITWVPWSNKTETSMLCVQKITWNK